MFWHIVGHTCAWTPLSERIFGIHFFILNAEDKISYYIIASWNKNLYTSERQGRLCRTGRGTGVSGWLLHEVGNLSSCYSSGKQWLMLLLFWALEKYVHQHLVSWRREKNEGEEATRKFRILNSPWGVFFPFIRYLWAHGRVKTLWAERFVSTATWGALPRRRLPPEPGK